MASSRGLRRLLRVLEIEEEQRRIELESVLGELGRLTRALEAAGNRERAGRELIASGVVSQEMRSRIAGVHETQTALRLAAALTPRITETERNALASRQEYLAKRTERRQAETLVEKAKATEMAEAEKRSQSTLDDCFLSRFQGEAKGRKAERVEQDRTKEK